MRRIVMLVAAVVIATLFGFFGQDIAYWLNENLLGAIAPVYYLTVLTLISLALFLTVIIYMYLGYRRQRIKKDQFYIFFPVTLTLTMLVSSWSVFVLAMWWR